MLDVVAEAGRQLEVRRTEEQVAVRMPFDEGNLRDIEAGQLTSSPQ